MSAQPAPSPTVVQATANPEALACRHCGGSGTLRMGDQQFRTCLDCLGQGQLPAAVQSELLFPCFSAVVSSAHAR